MAIDQDPEQLLARIKALESELSDARRRKSIDIRASKKGAISIYGLQRFPITLYANQWQVILKHGDEILKFIADHRAELDIRPDAEW